MQDEKLCYLTEYPYNLHKHHIYGGARRKLSEQYGCWVYLRAELHNMSNQGVHFNKQLDTQLKQECQRRFEEVYTREKFMELFGRNYL